MKLSEAISLGSTLSPQAFGHYVDNRGGRCAWAAALEAMGIARPDAQWNWTRRVVNCPHCQISNMVAALIIHLNDRHGWTRNQIAEWISTIEPTNQTSAAGEEFSCMA